MAQTCTEIMHILAHKYFVLGRDKVVIISDSSNANRRKTKTELWIARPRTRGRHDIVAKSSFLLAIAGLYHHLT